MAQLDLMPKNLVNQKYLPSGGSSDTAIANIFTLVVSFLTLVAGFWFAIQFILAGWQMLTAGSDSNKLAEAQKKILNSLIGLFVVIGAILIIKIIGAITGLNILDITKLINTLNG